MEADGIDPAMPPLPDLPYVDWLLEVGPTEAAGMGASVVGWRTLAAWQDCTGILLTTWEARLLRRLSADWLGESDRARKPDCPAPWMGEAAANRAVVQDKLRAAFKAMVARPFDR